MREHYEAFKKATMKNGGEPLLQKTKEEVTFDPNNMEHMEAVRVLFYPDLKSMMDVSAKNALLFKFKLEAPYHDIRSMVNAKIVQWAMDLHKRRMGKKLTVLKTAKTASSL